MIYAAITHIRDELNQYLQRTSGAREMAVVSNLVEMDGSVASSVNNKLALFLVNLEKDTAALNAPGRPAPPAARTVERAAPVYLNLYVMLASYFSGENYPESLKMLSRAIAFFQRQPVFDHQRNPALDPRIERLVLEIQNLSMQDLSNLWTVLSGKYVPSVLYKVRMVALDTEAVTGETPTVQRQVPKVVP